MSMNSEDRKRWLRGTYLGRIVEIAQHYAATRTYFIDANFVAFVAGEFEDLRDLSDDDRQYLRDQVGLESLRRVALSRARDREEIFGQLIADNDDVVARDAEFMFDIGGVGLVRDAVSRMRTYPTSWKVRLDGGKEKFGCLVLFVSFDVDARGAMPEIRRLREEVRLRSLATCDICGDPGRLRIGQWAKTTCGKHAAVLGSFREDDGRWADPWHWLEDGQDDPPEAAEVLKDLLPGRKRPKSHIIDLVPRTDIARQIEADIETNYGRKADLLLEFIDKLEIAVVAAMSVADHDVDFWLRSEVDRWVGVQPLSDDDRAFLRRYLQSLAIDERCRRQRRDSGAQAMARFFGDHPVLGQEAALLTGRERKLLEAYAGDLTDAACGSVVKEGYLDRYVSDEVALFPFVLDLSPADVAWLRHWLRRMIDAEYARIRERQPKS